MTSSIISSPSSASFPEYRDTFYIRCYKLPFLINVFSSIPKLSIYIFSFFFRYSLDAFKTARQVTGRTYNFFKNNFFLVLCFSPEITFLCCLLIFYFFHPFFFFCPLLSSFGFDSRYYYRLCHLKNC